jgi:hypothetical protein
VHLTEVSGGRDPHLIEIGERAFEDCRINALKLPSSLEILGNESFRWCGLKEVTFSPDSQLRVIGGKAFGQTKIRYIELPSTVEILGAGCFCECESLKTIIVPEDSTVREMGKEVFLQGSN